MEDRLAGACQSGIVSINVNLSLRVDGLRSSDTAFAVGAALQRLFAQEGITDDVELNEEPAGAMVWHTPYPLIISSFSKWHGPFEDSVRSAVRAVTPDLVVTIDWSYPDAP